MMNLSLKSFIGLIISLAVIISMQVSAIRVSISHLPNKIEAAELTRHSQLTILHNNHGHIHNDGEVAEQQVGHDHGHNETDHSHEMLYKAAYLFLSKPILAKNWEINPPVFADLEPLNTIEHPPRNIYFN